MAFLRAFGHELAYACRRLRQAPGFTAVAALTLGLGIGANTAVFSVIDPLLLRRLPVREPDQLVLLHSAGTLQQIEISPEGSAFERYSADRETLDGVLADGASLTALDTTFRGRHAALLADVVSTNYFDVLGVQPHRGRLLTADDGAAAPPVLVLSFACWRNTFGADPTVVGESLVFGGQAHTIVGVAPRDFSGLTVGTAPDFFAPLSAGNLRGGWVRIVARLRPGLTPDRARERLEPLFQQIAAASELPDIERQQAMSRLLVTPAGRGLSESRDALGSRPWALVAVVALVLLVACANVAGLVLTRSSARRHETALQLALGATRSRIVGRYLLEGAVIAGLGAVVGIVVAHFASRALVAWLSVGPAPLTLVADLNVRVLIFTAAVLSLTVLVCGAVPALASTRVDVASGLKSRGAGLERGARLSGLRRVLIVAQMAASVTLLSGAGLLVHSLINLHTSDVGFDPDRVLAVSFRDKRTGRPAGQADQLLSDLLIRTRALPGVEAAGLAGLPPLSGHEIGINIVTESNPSAAPVHSFFTPGVTPGYFETLGTGITSGLGCPTTAETTPSVILNQRLAARLFGEASPIGQRVRFVEGRRPPMAVVGVAADAIYVNIREEPRNFLYVCRVPAQSTSVGSVLFVRSEAGRADGLAVPVRQITQATDADVVIQNVQTLATYRFDSLHADRLVTGLFSGFTIVALMIAAVGLYGVLTAMVTRQTPEIGLRIALGADTPRIAWFVAAPAVTLTATGLALGSLGAYLSSSLLSSLLFGVSRVDPITVATVIAVMAAASALACFVPMRRAMRVDPVVALRAE